jgi:transposase
MRRDWKLFHNESEALNFRLLCLIQLERLFFEHNVLKDWMYKKVAGQFKVSARSLYRWREKYLSCGVDGVRKRKARGRKRAPLKGWVVKYIKALRDDYNWGAEVICAHLREDHGIVVSMYKVHRFLKERGYIVRKKRKIKTKRHRKKVFIAEPGAHTQLDVKHLPGILRNGRKCYVYNFVDHASRWQFKMVFESYGAWETYRFMQAVLDACPFRIKSLQTDHGIEFTYKFLHHITESTEHPLDHLCKVHGIRKRLIPVGEKEQNGLVERSHRQDDNELYETIRPSTVKQFNELLIKHTKWLNQYRRRKPLGWKTANQYLSEKKKKDQNAESISNKDNVAA